MAGPWPSHGLDKAEPWPIQVLPIHGGRDSGRLDFSVRTWPAEAATAADQKGAPANLTLTCMKGHVLGSALSHDPEFEALSLLLASAGVC